MNRPFRRFSSAGRTVSGLTITLHGGLLLLFFSGLSGCKEELVQPSTAFMKVEALAATVDIVPRTKSLTGTVGAMVQSDMAFQVAGRIQARFADVGDQVKAGDILAQVDSISQLADVAAAKAAVLAAKATLDERMANLARVETLLPKKAISQQEFEEANASVMVSRGELNISLGNLESAETRYSYTFLKASLSGVVIDRKAEAGHVVGPGESVYTIAASSELEASFDAFAVDFSDKPIDDRVDLLLPSDPSVMTVGIIREISPLIDEQSGTIRVKVTIPDPPPQMTLGSPVIGIGHFKPIQIMALPWTSLVCREDKPSVWVVDSDTHAVTERIVKIHHYASGLVNVSEGLEPGELVVVRGTQMIRPGQKVSYQILPPKHSATLGMK